MTDPGEYPAALDATPSDAAGEYGYDYLLEAGYLPDPETVTSAYGGEREVTYRRSIGGAVRIAYFEFPIADAPQDTPTEIVQGLWRTTPLQYFWFVDPETARVQVYRASRGNVRFVYDPDVHAGTTAARKCEKLAAVPEDIDVLFEGSRVVDRFSRAVWDHRVALARTLETRSGHDLDTGEALLAAQRLLDRLVFLYFLLERRVVVPVTEDGDVRSGRPSGIFETVVSERGDLWPLLRAVFFDGDARDIDGIERTVAERLQVPSLNGSLFEPAAITTADGTVVAEDEELLVGDFDWAALLEEFDEYDWQLDGFDGTGEEHVDTAGTLDPAVLGHIYETFVIPMRKGGDDVDLDEPDPSVRDARQSSANGEAGAYYTGEDVTDFKARRALWEGLREKIDDDLANGNAPAALRAEDVYRPGSERSDAIESAQKDGFEVLYPAYADSPDVLEYVDSKLTELRVCDPAVGSGSFALAVAKTLFEWRSMCRPDADTYELRREIITQNVFGVDLMEGATEICKLRLWLWLLGAKPSATGEAPAEGRDGIRSVPDVAFNVRTGNSLLGFVDPTAVSGRQRTLGAARVADRLRQYGKDVREYRESTDPQRETKRELERTHDDLKAVLDERYARSRTDSDGEHLTIADHVEDADEAWDSLHATPRRSTVLSVEIPAGIPDPIEAYLERRGLTTYKYTARSTGPSLERRHVVALFDRLREYFSDPDEWQVRIERAYAGRDFREEQLDACHWPLEFPWVFEENGGFDVVISNPPYGASISPAVEPLLRDETTYECQGASDSCEWFYERALGLVAENGVISYIVPKSIAFYSSWSDIRERLLTDTELKHVFDVGLGFAGVNLETIALIATHGSDGRASVPTVHRSEDRRNHRTNRPVHLGWVDQAIMMDAETVIFRPITDDQRDVLDRLRSHDRRLGDVLSTEDTTRQLYVPDSEKERLEDGDDHYINKNPWVQEFYVADVWHVDLSEYRDEVEEYTVPRVMLKVLRGTRLRAWIDPAGEVVGTEKLVNVPLEDSTPAEIAFVYAALNHPCASYYLQKAIFSETTESARVMDGQYSKPIPIPTVSPIVETAVAHLAWTITLARQLDHDAERALSKQVTVLRSGLHALLGGTYLNVETDTVERWSETVVEGGPATDRIEELFERFYTERFATRNGTPERYWDEIETVVDATVETVSQWETERITDADEMAVVEDVL